MKKADLRIVESWDTIQSKIKILHLSPGEWIKGRIEDESWMFVEEGFLSFVIFKKDKRDCWNFLWEGRDVFAYNICDPTDFEEFSFGIQAVEQSTVYIFSSEDLDYLSKACAGFFSAKNAVACRSWKFQRNVSSIRSVKLSGRIQTVQRFYSILLRAPERDLANFLKLNSKKQRMQLSAIRREHGAARNCQPS
jgi:hypothetical protein